MQQNIEEIRTRMPPTLLRYQKNVTPLPAIFTRHINYQNKPQQRRTRTLILYRQP
jgi:hypothetical protein